MDKLDNASWTRWKCNRRNTTIAYILIMFCNGLDYSIVFVTLYLYLSDMIKTDYPNAFFGIIVAAFSISSILFGIITARYLDKSRNIKFYTYIVIFVQIVGNLLYALPFSVILPLTGRFIAGIGDTIPTAFVGELARIYDIEKNNSVLWWLQCAWACGSNFGPIISISFRNVNFSLGLFEVNYLNFIGIFMAGLFFSVLIITHFLISDCSKEFDLKEYVSKQKAEQQHNQELDIGILNDTDKCELLGKTSTDVTADISTRAVLKVIWKFFDLKLMLVSTFAYSYILYGTELLIPLISYEILHWNVYAVAIMNASHGVIYILTLLCLTKICTTDKAILNMCVVFSLCALAALCILLSIKGIERIFERDISLMVLFQIIFVFPLFMPMVLFRIIVLRMIPSKMQSMAESLRFGSGKIGIIIASFTVPLALSYLQWWSAILIAVVVTILVCLIARKNTLTNLEVIPSYHFE